MSADGGDAGRGANARALAQAAARRRQVLLGGVSVGGFLVVGVCVLVWWLHQQSVENAAREEIERAQTALRSEVAALSLDDAAQATRVVRRLEETKAQWGQWRTADQFAQLLERAQAAVAAANTTHALQQAVVDLEQKAAAQPRELAAWATMHDRGNALVIESKAADKEMKQRLLACVDRIDEGYLGALRAAVAAGGADARATRGWLITAEELALAKVGAAERSRDGALRKRWDDEFLALAKQEDGLAAAAYDAATIAGVPWQDLLPGTQTADWVHSATPGLDHKVEGGALTIAAADAGAKGSGIVVLKNRTWRHCQVECEATLLGGSATVLLRAGKRADPRASAALKLGLAEGKDVVVLPAGQPTTIGALLVGDRLVVTAAGKTTEVRVPAHARAGGLAIVVEPGASLRLGSLKVKDLP
ncbi:MAG: hypothetical protein WBO45_18590 [Planctomycetota bacterium]